MLKITRKTIAILAAASIALLSCAAPSSFAEPNPKGNLIYAPRPPYPSAAARLGWGGVGQFLLHYRPDGTVSSVTVTKSTGHKMLDDTCRETFLRWRCRPGAYTKSYVPITFTPKRPAR